MAQPKPLTHTRIVAAILVNLTATPGLGSLACRRLVPGAGQLTLSVTGFCLITVWMLKMIYRSTMQQIGEAAPAAPASWMWKWGVLCFAAAWLWALVTSISLWRQAKALKQVEKNAVPPRIGEFRS